MNNLSKKDLVFISLMLFSLFFGAGNLIFPPFLGQLAGKATWISMLGFLTTAVGFPVLGIVAVAQSGGLHNLAKRVNPMFANIFTVLIYLSIGPCLGIPRAGSLPFEMAVSPYLPSGTSKALALLIFTLIFFSIAYWLSLTPSKLVNRMGKMLTPTLLVLIGIVFIASIFKPMGSYGATADAYAKSPFVKGFLDGYLTMDTIAALNFGIVIAAAIKSMGVKEEKVIISTSIKAGVVAGMLLVIIYAMLAHLGAASGSRFEITENGAQTLTNIMTYIFGKPGAVLLAIIFTLACITTCVGLITSCSQYFSAINSRLSYKSYVKILTLFSMIIANMGLNKILSISVPMLNAIYPIAIVLIILAMLDKLFKENLTVYSLTVLFTGLVSVSDALIQVGVDLGLINRLLSKLPLHTEGLGWIIPALIGIVLGYLFNVVKYKLSYRDISEI